ncbi:SIMPL domain-containing protein [Flavobacterium sp. JP2137]|uniref:SIMPL domain-containing protein n=1 Tax=Flavobacterium sp. JP2137 TaxID=3414510 RepID=UPI003D300627
MKKLSALFATFLFALTMNAQNPTAMQTPQISVSGVGKVSIKPDQATITIGTENRGSEAVAVKKENDVAIANIIKYLKKMKIAEKDYQTQRVNLYKNRDYETKQDYFQANQTITIQLKDLANYEELMLGLIQAGANQIQGVEFKSSKEADYQTEARTKAVANAKKKATDYANALGQKVGKAIFVSDESVSYSPRPVMYAAKAGMSADMESLDQTLAIGEIEVSANVSINFNLE